MGKLRQKDLEELCDMLATKRQLARDLELSDKSG
jgi:hypothetical protein